MPTFDRRKFLKALVAAGAFAVGDARAQTLAKPRFSSDPFRLGVASGYPSAQGVVLWTRLVTALDQPDGGMSPYVVPVHWEMATDERMRNVVVSGVVDADPAWGHSVHVDVRGLMPDRPYWYRFTAGEFQSPLGRTRTAPAFDTATTKLRFAFASCQHFEKGYFSAYRHMIADEPDFMVFLGDYIYETSFARDTVRKHDTTEPYSLVDYRARYAQYKADSDLQAAHSACPWVVTWDDHEVDNDYANDLPERRYVTGTVPRPPRRGLPRL
jgi:alkaline phosphatase D